MLLTATAQHFPTGAVNLAHREALHVRDALCCAHLHPPTACVSNLQADERLVRRELQRPHLLRIVRALPHHRRCRPAKQPCERAFYIARGYRKRLIHLSRDADADQQSAVGVHDE